MEQPNFALIPSGFKTAKVYSVIPESGVGDLLFDRSQNTATRINKDGLIESVDADIPRLNYEVNNGVVDSCPHLLLEMNSTNLITNYTGSGFSVFNGASKSANNSTSPDGTINATLITFGGTSNELIQQASISISNSQTYTASGYFKLKSGTLSNSNNAFKGLDGLVGAGVQGSTFNNALSNQWKRLEFTVTSSTTSGRVQIKCEDEAEILIWGLQLENETYATSVIPTSGSEQTRASESCTGAGDVNTFNSVEGILYAEMKRDIATDTGFRRVNINDGSADNTVRLGYSTVTDEIKGVVTIHPSTSISLVFTGLSVTSFRKMALLYKANKFELWVDGNREAQNTTQANTFAPNTLNDLSFQQSNASDKLRAKVKDVRYYDTDGMTDAEITNLLTQLTQ